MSLKLYTFGDKTPLNKPVRIKTKYQIIQSDWVVEITPEGSIERNILTGEEKLVKTTDLKN